MAEEILFDIFDVGESEEDRKYTTKVEVPQYLPNRECPKIGSLVNREKYTELVREINSSGLSDEEKEFLRVAATRHLVFDYSKVADYYAHAGKEMQRLMEKSALVIIDFNDAIANGYVKLNGTIRDILNEG